MRQPGIYALARRAMLVGQWLLRRPDEPDFSAFKVLRNESGLVVDIGANGGQSAIAFSFLLPRFDILSFEPNPALWRELEFIRRIIGRRFSFQKVGLGPQANQMTLFVPQIGDLPVTTRASLDRAAADEHCERLGADIGERPAIRDVTVDIIPFDSLGLRPDIIKIDVEGYEHSVLEGMTETLEAARPILLLESNANDKACKALLAPLGYRFYYFDMVAGRVTAKEDNRTRNWFAIPAHREALFCADIASAKN